MNSFTIDSSQYNPDPSASFYLDSSSAYFKDVPINDDADREELELKIQAACQFVERYCNRKFAQTEYSGVYTVRQDGSIILDNPPIQTIDRICYSNGGWLNISNPTSYSPSFSTGNGFMTLSQTTVDGYTDDIKFTYTDYLNLGALADAINTYGNGWTAFVTAGTDLHGFPLAMVPCDDIVAFQYGTANTTTVLLSWTDYQGMLAPNIWPTQGYYLQYDVSSGILDWYFPRGMRLRVDYTGGFDPVPEAIKVVTARLVLEASWKKSETLGQYSYTLSSSDDIVNSDKKLLGFYKDRRA